MDRYIDMVKLENAYSEVLGLVLHNINMIELAQYTDSPRLNNGIGPMSI